MEGYDLPFYYQQLTVKVESNYCRYTYYKRTQR